MLGCAEWTRPGRLFLLLTESAKSVGGEAFYAPFDIVLTEYDVLEPDLIRSLPAGPRHRGALSFDRADRPGSQERIAGQAPRAGVLVVDPQERTLEVRIERAGSYPDPILLAGGIYQSVTLPGLAVDVEALFA